MEILRRLPAVDLKNNVVRRRLTHAAVGTVVIGMTILGSCYGNNQDSKQILLPPPGIAQGDSDGNSKDDLSP